MSDVALVYLGNEAAAQVEDRLDDRELLAALLLLSLRDVRKALSAIHASLQDYLLPMLDETVILSMELEGASKQILRAPPIPEMSGASLKEWLDDLRDQDIKLVTRAVKSLKAQGKSAVDIVKEVLGTAGAKYRDGTRAKIKRAAKTLARTAVTHAVVTGKEAAYRLLGVSLIQWVSVLDSRTSDICRHRNGMVASLDGSTVPAKYRRLDPPGARPPAHPNCRSTIKRFSEDAPVPQTFAEWLQQQPEEEQREVLGAQRFALYQQGITPDQFVNDEGKRLTVAEIKKRYLG